MLNPIPITTTPSQSLREHELAHGSILTLMSVTEEILYEAQILT